MSTNGTLKSKLRIFLSVDIVGSTAFKQGTTAVQKSEKIDESSAPPAEPWFSPIVQFYREIERRFSREWQHYATVVAAKHKWSTGPSPEFWKGAGDELIYTKELTDHKEALACVHTWMKAINSYRLTFKKTYPSLDLKCAAWLAGFPVNNAEVFFRSSFSDNLSTNDDDPIYSNLILSEKYYDNPSDGQIVRDFIGPSMDTGFRLASLATPRKLVVSVDLALLLVHAARTQQSDFDYEQISFHYDGRVPLKGVLGGTPYPVFWIDMAASDPLNIAEDLLAATVQVDSDKVKKFCELFVDEHPNFVFKPYIVTNVEPYFGNVPQHHKDRLAKLQSYWETEKERRKEEVASEESPESAATTDSPEMQSSVDELVKWFGTTRLTNRATKLKIPRPNTAPKKRTVRKATGRLKKK